LLIYFNCEGCCELARGWALAVVQHKGAMILTWVKPPE